MRTTVTLDADTERIVRERMAQRGVTFKEALNEAIRAGASTTDRPSSWTRATAMGVPSVNLDRALQLAAELEDDELIRRMQLGK